MNIKDLNHYVANVGYERTSKLLGVSVNTVVAYTKSPHYGKVAAWRMELMAFRANDSEFDKKITISKDCRRLAVTQLIKEHGLYEIADILAFKVSTVKRYLEIAGPLCITQDSLDLLNYRIEAQKKPNQDAEGLLDAKHSNNCLANSPKD